MITPRKYQIEAVNAVAKARERGVMRQLISLPTGTGKTIVFALLAKRLNVRTLILAHREELLLQARDKMLQVWPQADVGLLRRKETHGLQSEICIASVQTASQPKRLAALQTRNFELVIIDEAHHATAESYCKILGALGVPLTSAPKETLTPSPSPRGRGEQEPGPLNLFSPSPFGRGGRGVRVPGRAVPKTQKAPWRLNQGASSPAKFCYISREPASAARGAISRRPARNELCR